MQARDRFYSAFFENDRRTATGLAGYLRERGLANLFLVGLAVDFCVYYSTEDGQRSGFHISIIDDACRAIDLGGSAAKVRATLTGQQIPMIPATRIFGG